LSRNKDRVGAHDANVETPHQTFNQDNSAGFSFVVPTEFVDLPSQGRYYPEGHPLHGQDTIEIRQMTAKEEDILTSRTLLKKGIALDRVLQSVIVDKRINAESMLVGDRNAAIMAMRISGYGATYETKVKCPSCGNSQKHAFDLAIVEPYPGDRLDTLGIVNNNNGTFDVELPQTKVTVTFRLLTGYDESHLLNTTQQDRKRSNEKNVTRQLENIVVAANGDSTPQAKKYLIDNIPSMDSRHLRLAFSCACPNIDLTQLFECHECDFSQDMEVPLSADFFWPDR
tara:strand:+ start:1316 stop:2167 length:852 start_codon:yes stop_codon:yes gene_type:complete